MRLEVGARGRRTLGRAEGVTALRDLLFSEANYEASCLASTSAATPEVSVNEHAEFSREVFFVSHFILFIFLIFFKNVSNFQKTGIFKIYLRI